MTEPTDKVDTPDARQASMSRVVTHESLMASLVAPASEEPAKGESEAADKPKEGEQKPAKKSPQERIVELAHKRREAEADAEAARREVSTLRAEMQAIKAQAQPMEATNKPARSGYASEDDYIDALTDWKADQAVAKRERQHAEARQQAQQAEIAQEFDKRQQKAIADIPDYAEVIGKSEVIVPPYVHKAMVKNKSGPEIAYYLALNPAEAKRITEMDPIDAIERVLELGKALADDDEPAKPEKAAAKAPAPKQSKAPEPINPIKGGVASNPGPAQSFEEYKRRRDAEKQRK